MNFTAGKAGEEALSQEQTLSLSYALHEGFWGKDGRKTQEILPIWEAAKMQIQMAGEKGGTKFQYHATDLKGLPDEHGRVKQLTGLV